MVNLSSKQYRVTGIKKNQSEGFKDIKVNDIVQFTIDVKPQRTRSRGGRFAPLVTCNNITAGSLFRKEFSQMAEGIEKYLEMEEIL